MICLIALVVFAVLGIFSAAYRKLAVEAFDCVFRKVTFRKCNTGLDRRLRADISGKLLKKNKQVGQFVYKYFSWISWAFTILFVVSLVYVGIGGYNYYLYGNCNGPNADGFCLFDPTGEHQGSSEIDTGCSTPELREAGLNLDINLSYFSPISNGPGEIYFIGCYACEYTRKAYPEILKLSDEATIYFAHFPVKEHSEHLTTISNCVAELEPERYKEFNDQIFSIPVEDLQNINKIEFAMEYMDLDVDMIMTCSESNESIRYAEKQKEELLKTGIYGTPLVFIGEEKFVGPKPARVYRRALNE